MVAPWVKIFKDNKVTQDISRYTKKTLYNTKQNYCGRHLFLSFQFVKVYDLFSLCYVPDSFFSLKSRFERDCDHLLLFICRKIEWQEEEIFSEIFLNPFWDPLKHFTLNSLAKLILFLFFFIFFFCWSNIFDFFLCSFLFRSDLVFFFTFSA